MRMSTMDDQSVSMGLGPIPLGCAQPIALGAHGILVTKGLNPAVMRDLGQNGRRRDADILRVPLDDTVLFVAVPVDERQFSVEEDPIRL